MNTPSQLAPEAGRMIVLLCHERSGSTLFGDLMAGRNDVAVAGDLWNFRAFDTANELSFYAYRQRRATELPQSLDPIAEEIYATLDGFFSHVMSHFAEARILIDIKYGHIPSVSGFWYSAGYGSVFLQYLKTRGIPLIHLYRRDVFAAVASGHLAMRRGVWNTRNAADLETVSLELEREPLRLQLADLAHNIRVWSRYCRILGGINLAYEDLIAALPDARAVFRPIEDYLGLPSVDDYSTGLLKVSPEPGHFIENYREVADLAAEYRLQPDDM